VTGEGNVISLVFPCYNEEEMIRTYPLRLFPVIDKIGRECGETFEFVMVDDGSSDATYPELQALARSRTDVIAVSHGVNRGMGAAIRTGVARSRGDPIITMDADLTFRPDDIPSLIAAYRRTGADCVSGSPYIRKGLIKDVSRARLVLSVPVNLMYRVLLGRGITAVSPVFRLYKRSVFDHFSIESNNFEINAEILAKLIIAGRRVVEVPVELHKREHGTSKIRVFREIKNNIRILGKIAKTKYFGRPWT
jgi:glycosyltransferase involved in cell wall biosynthesis